jgi:hypothetical protein
MIAEHLNWDLNDPSYSSQEAAMTDYRGVVLPGPDRGQPFVINALSSMTTDATDITNDKNFGIALEQHVTVSVAALDTTKTAPGQIHSKAGKPVDLKQKEEAHEALLLMFKPDGVPPKMILDGSKRQVKGVFRHKLKEVNCHMQVTEPYSPLQQAAKGCICEFKQGVSHKKIRTGAPKLLWGHYSHAANNIYATGGEVPETIMKGGTADISQICEFAWYDWVMFCDTVNRIASLDKRLTLGRYLGPATDGGLALAA